MDHPVAEYRQGWVASNQVWLAGHLLSNPRYNEFELPREVICCVGKVFQ
jgi:hypothetical protein